MVRERGPLCVGIDPHPGSVPKIFGSMGPGSISLWGRAIVEHCAGRVAMVKPQMALFERWGAAGIAALEDICDQATKAGLLVMLDAKRGDIGSTAMGYAEAYLKAGANCPCDALTVNPYMGLDTLEPFVETAEKYGKGLAVLVRTSNPGAADFQGLIVENEPLYLHVGRAVAGLSHRLRGKDSHWSGLMMVVGATAPDEAQAVRALAPDCPFLVPGYGAQGGKAQDALSGFVAEDGILVGGVVNSSRGIAGTQAAVAAVDGKDWDEAVHAALTAAETDLFSAARLAGT